MSTGEVPREKGRTPGEWQQHRMEGYHYLTVSGVVGAFAAVQHYGVSDEEADANMRDMVSAVNSRSSLLEALREIATEADLECPECGAEAASGGHDRECQLVGKGADPARHFERAWAIVDIARAALAEADRAEGRGR